MALPESSNPALLLCDFAEVINGKLYIMGAGISHVMADQPVSLALAVMLSIPWQQTNRAQRLHVSLVDEDGKPLPGTEDEPFAIDGEIEIGRPPGAKHGVAFPAPIALRLPPMAFPTGSYRFELHLNKNLVELASFQAVPGGLG